MVFTRATSKWFILKKRSESAQDDQLIKMYPPKRKHSEDPVTTVFHECPIESDDEMKCVEDEAYVPHTGKPESETATGGLPKKVPEDPPLEKENPKVLSVAALFQQKLSGSGLGHFMESTTNSLFLFSFHLIPQLGMKNL
ncbi:unnamed protein product [Lactuca virosa]|uniref:Uncharacterized protein n=1 Tax=Lactuca virosa TaxID=75947 RepID=A0AAU9MNC5_9ASTR|nr:unnamed protein product [Lactuca virosa]